VNRIHRWLEARQSKKRKRVAKIEPRRIVRRVETVEREEKAILFGTLNAGNPQSCPLCGQKLSHAVDDSTTPQLPQ
jgi:hypothetical protein